MQDKRLVVVDNTVVADAVTQLREHMLRRDAYRELMARISLLLSATMVENEHFPCQSRSFRDNEKKAASGEVLRSEYVTLLSVIRAGYILEEPVRRWFPDANLGHLRVARNKNAGRRIKLTFDSSLDKIDQHKIVVFDPMIDTGDTALEVLDLIGGKSEEALKRTSYISILSKRDGLEKVFSKYSIRKYPELRIYTACYLDEDAEEKGLTLQSFGDLGERMFGLARTDVIEAC